MDIEFDTIKFKVGVAQFYLKDSLVGEVELISYPRRSVSLGAGDEMVLQIAKPVTIIRGITS